MPSGAETTIIARKGETELTVREMGVSKLQNGSKNLVEPLMKIPSTFTTKPRGILITR